MRKLSSLFKSVVIMRYAFLVGLVLSMLPGILLNSNKLFLSMYFIIGLVLALISVRSMGQIAPLLYIQISLLLLAAGIFTGIFDAMILSTMYIAGGVVSVAITGVKRAQEND